MKNQYYVTKYDVKADNAFALEDNIMVKDGITTAGSKMLHNYISPIDATVVRKLLDKGMELAGKTKLDEFAVMGVSGDNNELSGVVGLFWTKPVGLLCATTFRKGPQTGSRKLPVLHSSHLRHCVQIRSCSDSIING